MRRVISKLMIGRGHASEVPRHSTILRRWENLVAIWNNTYEEDAGLEKAIRLILAASQFFFPGMYIKHLFWRKGTLYQDAAIEFFVLCKTALPVVVLYLGLETQPVLYWLVVWLMVETIIYIPTLIFASDAFPTPRSYRRSKILIFLNYLEVVFSFGVIHAAGQHLNQPFAYWFDAVYFSITTTSTIGFGDYYPVTTLGKVMVSLQSLFYLSYIALFISFFNLGNTRGYFGDIEKK